MKRDWKTERAKRDAVSRQSAQQIKQTRKAFDRSLGAVLETDIALPIGHSALYELASPYRHASGVETTGARDMTKPFGMPDTGSGET